MKHLIDKDALVAEIDRKIEAHKETLKNCDSRISEMVLKGSMSAYLSLLHFLDTIEVKEVDLKEEICTFFSKNPIPYEHITDWPLLKNCAIHFFELGMSVNNKAQEGK